MSTKYDRIKEAIQTDQAIQARYKAESGFRKFWPHVLGPTTDDPDPRVLAYLYDGPSTANIQTPHPNVRNLRCFKLVDLSTVSEIAFEGLFDPIEFTFDMAAQQTCVNHPELYH